MIGAMGAYVRVVDAVNYRIGRVIMWGLFVMMAILLWSSISKTFFLPSLWTLEMAQFALVAYYIMGGPYSGGCQLGVRFSTNAPMPSSASSASRFSTMTWAA